MSSFFEQFPVIVEHPMSRRVAILFLFALLFSACAPASVQTPEVLATVEATSAPTEVTATSTPSSVSEATTPNSFVCYDQKKIKEMCLGLKPVDQKAQMEFVYENFFTSPSNAQYFQELLGLPKGTVVTAEQVRAWGEKNGMKFPAVSPAGTPLVFLQAESASAGGRLNAKFASNEQVQKIGAIDFSQGLKQITFDKNTWGADAGGVKTEVKRLMALNGRSWLIFSGGSTPSSAAETYGLLFDENGMPVMIMGSTNLPDFAVTQKTDKYLFGGKEANSTQLASVIMEGYWRALGQFINDDFDPLLNESRQSVKFSVNPEARDVLQNPSNFSGDNAWFTVVQQ